MGATYRCGNEVHHYTNKDFDRIGHGALTRLMVAMDRINANTKREEEVMEMTAHELEALAAERLSKEFWAILENNGMMEMATKREAALVRVRKAPRHPGHYMVTAA